MKVHDGAAPACEIVTVCVATVSVPVRPAGSVFAATVYWTVPSPLPLAPDAIAIQFA